MSRTEKTATTETLEALRAIPAETLVRLKSALARLCYLDADGIDRDGILPLIADTIDDKAREIRYEIERLKSKLNSIGHC